MGSGNDSPMIQFLIQLTSNFSIDTPPDGQEPITIRERRMPIKHQPELRTRRNSLPAFGFSSIRKTPLVIGTIFVAGWLALCRSLVQRFVSSLNLYSSRRQNAGDTTNESRRSIRHSSFHRVRSARTAGRAQSNRRYRRCAEDHGSCVEVRVWDVHRTYSRLDVPRALGGDAGGQEVLFSRQFGTRSGSTGCTDRGRATWRCAAALATGGTGQCCDDG